MLWEEAGARFYAEQETGDNLYRPEFERLQTMCSWAILGRLSSGSSTGSVARSAMACQPYAVGVTWACRYAAILQRLMRHAEITTTMKYYVTMDCDEEADGLWDRDWDSGNRIGNIRPLEPQNSTGDSDADTLQPTTK